MKLKLLLLLSVVFHTELCFSQEKTIKNEDDGFVWYLVTDGKLEGAQSKDGRDIIPLSGGYSTVYYLHLDGQDRGFFNVMKNHHKGICDKYGRVIISPDRGYDFISYIVTDSGHKYFNVEKDGKSGACNLLGEEIVAPLYYTLIYSDDRFKGELNAESDFIDLGVRLSKKDLLDENTNFKQLRKEKGGFEWYYVFEGEFNGAESKNGKVLIPTSRKYDDISYIDYGLGEPPFFRISKNGKKGICDLAGKEVIPPQYSTIIYTSTGFDTQLTESSGFVETNIKLDSNGYYATSTVSSPTTNNQNTVAMTNTHRNTVDNAVSHTYESSTRTWREDLVGGFVMVTQYPNGSQQRVRYRQCPNCRGSQSCGICHGTRACGICGGRGGIVSAGYGTYIPCVSCMGTGHCQICKGTGQCMCTTLSQYPGYVIGSSAFIGADGSVDKSTADYNNSSSSTTSTTSSRTASGKCIKCGGTGVDPQPNSGGGLPEWVKYYHQEGSECQYCGKFIAHFHNRCSSCNVPTR